MLTNLHDMIDIGNEVWIMIKRGVVSQGLHYIAFGVWYSCMI